MLEPRRLDFGSSDLSKIPDVVQQVMIDLLSTAIRQIGSIVSLHRGASEDPPKEQPTTTIRWGGISNLRRDAETGNYPNGLSLQISLLRSAPALWQLSRPGSQALDLIHSGAGEPARVDGVTTKPDRDEPSGKRG